LRGFLLRNAEKLRHELREIKHDRRAKTMSVKLIRKLAFCDEVVKWFVFVSCEKKCLHWRKSDAKNYTENGGETDETEWKRMSETK